MPTAHKTADDAMTTNPATEFTNRAPATQEGPVIHAATEEDSVVHTSTQEDSSIHDTQPATEVEPDHVQSILEIPEITHAPEFRNLLRFLQQSKDLRLDNVAKLVREMKDVNMQDARGVTPLLWLIQRVRWSYGEYAITAVTMVVEGGADVGLRDKNGTTPLLQLVHNVAGELRKHFLGLDHAYLQDLLIQLRIARILARLFLHNHANPMVMDKDGESAYDYARGLQQDIKRSLMFEPDMRINFSENFEDTLLEDHEESLDQLVDPWDINLCPHLLRYKSESDGEQLQYYDLESYIDKVFITLKRDLDMFLGDIVQEGERRTEERAATPEVNLSKTKN